MNKYNNFSLLSILVNSSKCEINKVEKCNWEFFEIKFDKKIIKSLYKLLLVLTENSDNTPHQNKSFLHTYSIQKQNPVPALYIVISKALPSLFGFALLRF